MSNLIRWLALDFLVRHLRTSSAPADPSLGAAWHRGPERASDTGHATVGPTRVLPMTLTAGCPYRPTDAPATARICDGDSSS